MGGWPPTSAKLQLDLEVWDLRQLNQLITQIRELPSVSTVKRVFE